MPKYVLDTNLYIRATRDDDWNRQLAAFVTTFTPEIHLHSVVAFELLAGALTSALRRRTQRHFIEPFDGAAASSRRAIHPGSARPMHCLNWWPGNV
ncbi:MAG: type II toxin-antitoxin system VapC family toxin [Longimicrobiales bacterium]